MSEKIEPNSRQAKHEPAILAAEEVALRKKQTIDKLQRRLHYRFPDKILDPNNDDRACFVEKDEKDNVETLPENGVGFQLACIEVSEIFGPNEIGALYDNLLRLGWDRDQFLHRESNISWLRRQRLYGSEATLPLGFVHRSSEANSFLGVRYTAVFPDEFSSIYVNISQLSPSVTCLTVSYILTESNSYEYLHSIQTSQKTTRVPKDGSGGYWIKDVARLKEEQVDKIRSKYRNFGISWLSNNFPGFFSVRCKANDFPTSEIIVFEGYLPFNKNEPNQNKAGFWARFLNVHHYHSSWVSSAYQSLRFSLESLVNEKLPNHLIVGLRWDDLDKSNLGLGDESSLASRASFAISRLDGITSRFALICYMKEIHREIKELRQSLGSPAKNNDSRIKQIADHFQRSMGVPAIAREMPTLSQDDSSFRWNATGFLEQSFFSEKTDPIDISLALQARIKSLSSRLIDEDRDTRELLAQISDAVATNESIIAQKHMKFLTVASIILGMCSLLAALFANKN